MSPRDYALCRALIFAGKCYVALSLTVSGALFTLATLNASVNPLAAFASGMFITFLAAVAALSLWGAYEWFREQRDLQ